MWKFAGVCLVAGLVAGCGGGGGGGAASDSPNTNPTGAQPLTLSGNVVMGPVSNATVQAFCHDVTPAALIGSGSSGSQANYSFTTTRACADVVELRVSGGTYVDEATGNSVVGASSPWLHAWIDGSGGIAKTAQITALTEVLHSRVTSNGNKPTAAALAAANQQIASELNQVLTVSGLDVTTTSPSTTSSGTSTDAGAAYTLLLGAVSHMSSQHSQGFGGAVSQLVATDTFSGNPMRTALATIATSVSALGRMGLSATMAQALVRPEPMPAKAMVSTSALHTLALSTDGSVWAWGHNLAGQLGDGTQIDRATPIRVASLSAVVEVSAGSFWSMALRADGTVWAWGSNFQANLASQGGDQYVPMQIQALAGIRSVSAGAGHGLALKSDGTVLSWGGNSCGQLGVPPSTTPNEFRSSIQAVAGVSGAVQILAGNGRSLARLSDGTVMAWGCESSASGLTIQPVPRAVSGLSGSTWISTGGSSSSSVKSDGTLVSWGYDSYGHFGLNSFATTYVTTPVSVPNLSGVARSAINHETALALKADGTVYSAGKGYYGELGDGRYGSFGFNSARSTFAQISALSRVVLVALGDGHAVALDADGSVWTWGRNDVGQLGRVSSGQTTGDGRPVSATPSKIGGLNLGATALAAGGTEGGGGSPPSTLSYEQLASMLTREFTGTNLQVRQCTDRVDALFPSGVGADTEPTWPAPYVANIKTGVTCSPNFGLAEYSTAYVNLNGCALAYVASDFEAVGRRGYAPLMALARDNLLKYYNIRRSKDALTYDQVCWSR